MKILSYLYWKQPAIAIMLIQMMPKHPEPGAEHNEIDEEYEELERLMKQPPRPGRG